jgi:hypothetical protein
MNLLGIDPNKFLIPFDWNFKPCVSLTNIYYLILNYLKFIKIILNNNLTIFIF